VGTERFVPRSLFLRDTDARLEPLPVGVNETDHCHRHIEQRGGEARDPVEPVFGIVKSAMGFLRFSLRGLEKVKLEWTLISLAYNCRRMATLKAAIA